jgi:hypothetical protein
MSLQATHLGHGRKGLELAGAAAPSAGPRLVAFLRGQQAAAAAMTGARQAALGWLKEDVGRPWGWFVSPRRRCAGLRQSEAPLRRA